MENAETMVKAQEEKLLEDIQKDGSLKDVMDEGEENDKRLETKGIVMLLSQTFFFVMVLMFN